MLAGIIPQLAALVALLSHPGASFSLPLQRRFGRNPTAVAISSVAETDRSSALDWSFLDGVYLITCPNADPGGERLEKATGILNEVGLLDLVEIKSFDTDDEDRIRGCYTSHISVYKDILATISKQTTIFNDFFGSLTNQPDSDIEKDMNVLILEDNLALSSGEVQQSVIDSIVQYTTENPTWDMVHLSYIPYVPDLKVTKTDQKDIVKLSCGVGSALGTTAYIINVKAIKRLLQEDKEQGGFYLPIPDLMAKLFPESRYATNPTMFVRAPNTKSLVNPQLDDLRALLFQPSVAVLIQSVLASTGLTTNALLPIVIASLLLCSGLSISSSLASLNELLTTGTIDGPIIVPVLSSLFSVLTLLIIAQGAILAPKQAPSPEDG